MNSRQPTEDLTSRLRDVEARLQELKEEALRLKRGGLAGNIDMALSYVKASLRATDG